MPEQMTKQDAIEYLLYMKHDVQAKSPMDIALDTAIEALKQPTIEPEVRHGRWMIPCSERLPEKGGLYLTYQKELGRFQLMRYSPVTFLRNGTGWFDDNYGLYVTHWLPLPETPEIDQMPTIVGGKGGADNG